MKRSYVTMDKSEIENMPASRELDVLIAEKVLGLNLDWEFAEFQDGDPAIPTLRDKYDEIGIVPFYSTDISAAWDVVEKLRLTIEPTGINKWYSHRGIGSKGFSAESAPLAICRAAIFYASVALPGKNER